MPHTFGAGLIWPRSNEFNLFFLSNMKFLFWLSFFSNNFLRFSLFHSYFSKPLIAFYWVFIELIQLRQITANFPQYYFSMLLPTYLLVFNFLFNLMMSQFGHLFTCNTGFFLLHSHTDLNLFCYVFTYFLNLLCCIDCFLQSIFILWVLGLCLIAFRLVLRSLTVFHCSTEFLDEIEFDSILFFSFFWGGFSGRDVVVPLEGWKSWDRALFSAQCRRKTPRRRRIRRCGSPVSVSPTLRPFITGFFFGFFSVSFFLFTQFHRAGVTSKRWRDTRSFFPPQWHALFRWLKTKFFFA